MRREEVISSILDNLDYRDVSPFSPLWQRASHNLEHVLKDYLSGGYFRNLQRLNVVLTKENDPEVLANFTRYNAVYQLPSDFGCLESVGNGLYIGFYNNAYYLCVTNYACFYGVINYSVQPDFSDFEWCDPVILHSIITATALRIKAMDSGQGLQYIADQSAKALSYGRRPKTRRNRPFRMRGM